jgi:succinate-semialdehyde dehydrogenase/glutarate-semialdehyde dehydrogenase
MAATAIPIETIPSINPATGEVIGYVEKTPPAILPTMVERARAAQKAWGKLDIRERCARLNILRERMLASRDLLANTVVLESGKPRVEAIFADVFVGLDTAAYFARHGARLLRSEHVPHHSMAAKALSMSRSASSGS